MPTVNLATKFSSKVDEAFSKVSLKAQVTNNDYDWQGVDTVKVYSIPVVALTDYTRSGANRYGSPSELTNEVQTLQIRKDRSWTFTIDKLNKNQSMMVMDAGKAVARQLRLAVIPEVDTYTFLQIAKAAPSGHIDTTAATKDTAYGKLLNAQEVLGNANVPDEGRVALVSYKFAGLLKQDPAFMRECDTAQNMQIKGLLGMVDGVKIIKVPSARMPQVTDGGGNTTVADFILTHPIACVAPTVLSEYKIHTDAPGISGWLVEGRISYDAFVLNNKKDAIFYCGPSLS